MALQDALNYLAAGIKVVPCFKNSKVAIVPPAPLSEADLRGHFAAHADYNLAILTGAVNGILVVDVDYVNSPDPDVGGFAGLAAFQAMYGNLPDTAVRTDTPSGGYHLYFKLPDQGMKVTMPRIVVGVDIRADNGFVTAPPSVVSGKTYKWHTDSLIGNVGSLPAAPAWLISLATQKYQEGEPTPTFTDLFQESCWDFAKKRQEINAQKARSAFATEDWEAVQTMYNDLVSRGPHFLAKPNPE